MRFVLLCYVLVLVWGLFWDRVSPCCSGWPWTCYVVQASLELVILLPLTPKCSNYYCAPPCSATWGNQIHRMGRRMVVNGLRLIRNKELLFRWYSFNFARWKGSENLFHNKSIYNATKLYFSSNLPSLFPPPNLPYPLSSSSSQPLLHSGI
jgi:hypothetical protein